MRGWKRWDAALRRNGFDSTPVHGVDVRRIVGPSDGLAGYFGKAALELTSVWTKEGGAGRTPFAILRDATETYAADDLELWWEFERVSHGRKQLTWSTGRKDLRKLAGLGRERTDEEIAADETGGDDAIALVGETWSEMSSHGEQPDLLSTTDEEGLPGAVAWLEARGYAWAWCRPAGAGAVSGASATTAGRGASSVAESGVSRGHGAEPQKTRLVTITLVMARNPDGAGGGPAGVIDRVSGHGRGPAVPRSTNSVTGPRVRSVADAPGRRRVARAARMPRPTCRGTRSGRTAIPRRPRSCSLRPMEETPRSRFDIEVATRSMSLPVSRRDTDRNRARIEVFQCRPWC